MPTVGWDGRDVSGLSHEQIHRWTRDGASPESLAAARDRHLARADELRTAADRLQAAQRGVGETWVGRDADAAGARTRVLAQRMGQLSETVGGQARGIDGLRAALVRVQAAVGPPRPPALPTLGVTPVVDELRSLVTGRPADGYGGFRAAAADQAAAREAYRAYLGETAAAARGVGPAGAGPAPAPGTVPGTPPAPGRAPLPVGARGAASGVLQRAAGPTPVTGAFPTTGAGVRPPGAPGAGAAVPARAPTELTARGVVPGPGGGAPVGPSTASAASVPSGGAPGPLGAGAGPAAGVPGGGGAPGGASSGGGAPGGGGGGTALGAAVPGRSGPGAGTRPFGAGPGGPRPVDPTRRPDERAPSAGGRSPGPPGVLVDHRTGARPADFGPDGPPAEAPRADDGEDPVEEGREAVPVRHVSWLVDPDPAGWGTPGRRVVPPVLGEGP